MKKLSITFKDSVYAGLAAATAFWTIAMPASAQAATVVGPAATASSCTNFTFNVTIISCAGGYSGNLLQSSLTNSTGLAAVAALGGSGGTFLEPKLEGLSSASGIINFNNPLNGLTIFGMHTGKAGDKNGQGTYFFAFDAGAGTDVIRITKRFGANETGLSNAALFKTGVGAVPEPSTWMLMLLGMAGVGFSMRRKKDTAPRVRFA